MTSVEHHDLAQAARSNGREGTTAPQSMQSRRHRRPRRHLARRWAPLVLLAPALGLMVIFNILPAALAGVVALYEWSLLSGSVTYVGLDNFQRILTGAHFQRGLWATILYTVLTLPLSLVGGLIVALAINSVSRGKVLWRVVYFLPVAATLAGMSVAWRWLFHPNTGLVDSTIGRWTGWTDWLATPSLAVPALAIVGVWQAIGFVTIIFLAGLAGVPREALEASRVDGANALGRFLHVQWPALGPAAVFALIVTTIQAFRMYDIVAIMTQGGPSYWSSTLTYQLTVRSGSYLDIGGAAVVNVALVVLVIAVAALQLKGVGRRWETRGTR